METLTYNMRKWSTDELIGEIVRRSATDGPALAAVEGVIIRARLAESEGRFAQSAFPADLMSTIERAGVQGTIEMGVADDGEM